MEKGGMMDEKCELTLYDIKNGLTVCLSRGVKFTAAGWFMKWLVGLDAVIILTPGYRFFAFLLLVCFVSIHLITCTFIFYVMIFAMHLRFFVRKRSCQIFIPFTSALLTCLFPIKRKKVNKEIVFKAYFESLCYDKQLGEANIIA